ncbi:MAG: hypothetical protein QXG38_01250 [Candidatus Hadarchaeales archaeon]
MGILEDIHWLKSNADGWGKIFEIVAGSRAISIPEIKEKYGGEDWWPVKSYITILKARGLVAEENGLISLTEQGKKVHETMKTIEEVATV